MGNNKLTKVTKSSPKPENYNNLLNEIKSLIEKGLSRAYQAVDNIKVQIYWQVGDRIVREELKYKDRADYGKYLIDRLSADLDIDRRELYRIIKFYRTYEIVGAVHPQLSWYHYLELIKVEDNQKRSFYENKTIINSWGYRELRKQIKNNLFENTSQQEIENIFKSKLPAVLPQKVFKDTYDFGFIGLPAHKGEKGLEQKLMENFELFLKALGEDFAILGRQTPIKIDSQTHNIDLVLYHRGIPCVVLVDLKIGKLDSRDIGQMNKYISYYRRNKQYEHEQDAIGLIICREAGKEEVMYALDGLEEKMFIAKYRVKLPSENEIKKKLKKLK